MKRCAPRCRIAIQGAALLLLLAADVTPAPAAARYVKVTNLPPGGVVWMRSGPGHFFKRIGFLPHGARHVRAYQCKQLATGAWCQVRYQGTRGWASQRYLAKDPTRLAFGR
jgi:uncharacterized protein YraI